MLKLPLLKRGVMPPSASRRTVGQRREGYSCPQQQPAAVARKREAGARGRDHVVDDQRCPGAAVVAQFHLRRLSTPGVGTRGVDPPDSGSRHGRVPAEPGDAARSGEFLGVSPGRKSAGRTKNLGDEERVKEEI